MRIGIVGSGNIGGTAARLLVQAGHEVAIANSRGPDSLADLVAELGDRAQAATVEDAARFGELALVAIPLKAYTELPADAFRGDVVVDAMNYYPQRDGQIAELDRGEVTSSELLQRRLSGAKVVKAFNTIYYRDLGENGRPEGGDERQVICLAGDDEQAKGVVTRLIEELGFAPLETGTLAESAIQEPGAAVYNQPMTAAQAREALQRIP